MKSSRFVFSAVLFSSLVFSATLAAAQENVTATVSAVGAGNTPDTSLTKDNFKVKDTGKDRPITVFAAPSVKPAAPTKLQPNEFSNISDPRETNTAIFVVLDTTGTRYADERDSRAQILGMLAKAAHEKHAVTLALLSDKGLRVYHDYRSGSDVLLAALSKAGLGGVKGVASPASVNEADVTAEAARLTAFSKGEGGNPATPEQLRMSVDGPMFMFQEVALAAAGLPGRKMLVWVTNAVPFDIDPKTKQFKTLLESSHGVAVGSGVGSAGGTVGGTKESLSSADIKKIQPIWRRSVRALFDGGVSIYPVGVQGSSAAGASSFTIDTMKSLAQLTGGKAFWGSNDPFPDIFNASLANAAGYTLGYAGDASTGTDFHPVDVSVNKGDVQLSQSAGYFPYEGAAKARAGQELALAMSSPLEFTGVLFKVAVAGFEDAPAGKKKVNLVITIPGESGILNEATGAVDVGFLAEATNATGQKVGTMNEGAGGKFPPEAVAQIKEMGFQLKRSFEVSPGDCTVHFLVRDNQTSRTGDVIFPMSVK